MMAGRAQGGDLDDLKKRNRRRDHRFRVSRGVVRAKSEHSKVSRELRTDLMAVVPFAGAGLPFSQAECRPVWAGRS